MNAEKLTTIDELRAFLDGSQRLALEVASNKDSRYRWIQRMLTRFRYRTLT